MNRRSVAAAYLLILPLALGGCWAQEEEPATSAPTTPAAPAPSPGASVAPFEHNGVTVTGALGTPPTITLADDFDAVTELDVADVVVGAGATATAEGGITAHYVGMGEQSRQVFDSSWDGEPATFDLAGLIPGFSEGLVGMKVGGRRLLIIPGSLGYGEAGSPPAIGPNETLVFVVDLLSVS